MRVGVVVFLALTACKKDTDDGAFGRLPDAKVTIIAEGAGPENEDTLQPIEAGHKGATVNDAKWHRWAGLLDAGRDDVFVHDVAGGNQPLAPTVGHGVALYRLTDDGLVLHASDAPLDEDARPVLMVPTTVRLGMKWESEIDDENVNVMEVVAHETVMLPTGPAEAWAIAEYFDETSFGAVRWWAEGIGRIGTTSWTTEWSADIGYEERVLPIDAQAHVEPALDPQPLTNVLQIEDHGETGHEVWGLSGAVFNGVLYAYMDGEDPAWGFAYAAPHDYCAELDATPAFVASGAVPGCATHLVSYTDPYTGLTYEAQPVLVDNAAQILPGLEASVDVNGAGAVIDEVLTAWIVDGVPLTLEYKVVGGAGPAQFLTYHPTLDNPEIRPTHLTDAISLRGVHLGGTESLVNQVWIGPARAAADATVHFAVVAADGQVFRVTLADETLSGFVPVGLLPGAISILLDGDERMAYSITRDGRVFELRVDQATGDVAIRALGSVRVEEEGGGYEFKGVIADPTHPGDFYVAAIATSLTSVPVYRTGIFRAHLDADPVDLVTAPSLLVGASDTEVGILVCWPPSDEPFDGAGWTLRGEPVEVIGPVGADGHCALVATDLGATIDPAWVGAGRALEATLPGVGAVRLGFPADRLVGHSLFGSFAVLRDGRVVDAKGLVLDHHGLPIERKFSGVSSPSQVWPRDLGGYGLWVLDNSTTGGFYVVRNIGGGIATPPCPAGPEPEADACTLGGLVEGGGALYDSPLPVLKTQVLRPDGTVEDIPEAQRAAARQGLGGSVDRVLLADGRICGLAGYPWRVDCFDASGAVTTTGPLPSSLADFGDWWPLTDGTWLVGNSLRFDPATTTATILDERSLVGAITSSDGQHVYAIAHDGGVTEVAHVVEITPQGATDLVQVSPTGAVLPIEGALLVRGAIVDGFGTSWWYRLPR